MRITVKEQVLGDLQRQSEGEQSALSRAAKGDSMAFAELLRAHQNMVFSIAYHFLRDRALAEDLAQEVFLELFQSIDRVQSPEHLVYWLRRVTANRCIDQGRKKVRRSETALEDTRPPVTSARETDPFLLDRLQDRLADLPEKQRMIVILRYQEDLGPAEIAEILKIPVNTVKSTLHRSLEELRKGMVRTLRGSSYAFF